MIWGHVFVLFTLILTVKGDDPIIIISETDPPINVAYNEIVSEKDRDVQLTCVVQNKPEGSDVKWVGFLSNSSTVPISEATDSTDAFKYSIDQPSPTAWRLRIQNAQVTDEGKYECNVQTGNQIYVRQAEYLRVVETPQIADLQTSSDTIVKDGDKVDLWCNATGRPFPLVKWSRLAGEILPTGGQELRAYHLNIQRAKAEHSGIYKCTAANEAGVDERKIYLTVKYHPTVTAEMRRIYQAQGYVKSLVCNIAAYPVPDLNSISWTRGSMPIQSGGHRSIRNIPGALSKVTSILTIYGVREEDYGEYTCSAQNSQGEGADSMTLIESSQPTPDRTGKYQRSGATILTISVTTVIMLLSVCLLQN
ncbi:hypothetical protein SNE40_016708 [Patella caerulea]|uniref:Ig-like domain-containing protein n=1 Tax=Patella caerulea TaxID=87958 RepID=A0AAN8JAI7_PATCE